MQLSKPIDTLPKSKIYIVILNWNGWKDTIECLESVFRMDFNNYQVVLCDNNSQDASVEYIKAWADGRLDVVPSAGNHLRHLSFPPIHKPLPYVELNRQQAEAGMDAFSDNARLILIQTGGNLGFAGGNNIGLRYALSKADFSYVWLLNNDTVVDSNALSSLISRVASDRLVGMCGASVRYYDNPDRYQAFGGATYNRWLGYSRCVGEGAQLGEEMGRDQAEMIMDYIAGSSMLVSSEFLRTVGLMEESYFLYFEELDWAERCRGRFKLSYAPESIVYHKDGASIGTKNSSEKSRRFRSEFYYVRNRLIITRKYFPYAITTVYIGIIATIVIRFFMGEWRRCATLIGVVFELAKSNKSVGATDEYII